MAGRLCDDGHGDKERLSTVRGRVSAAVRTLTLPRMRPENPGHHVISGSAHLRNQGQGDGAIDT